MLVNDIIARVARELIDSAMIRWRREDLVAYLGEAFNAIVVRRPSLSSKTVTLDVTDSPVSIPEDGFALLSVESVDDIAVQYVLIEKLDQLNPYWRKEKGAPSCWTKREGEDRRFWLYPQPNESVRVSICYAQAPIVTPDTDFIDIPPIFLGALIDFMMYRAYSRDSENPMEATKSQLHFQSFALFMNDDRVLKAEKDQSLIQSTVK
ncbi:DUF6682 family protein [Photobacterium damselae]|uniref:phage adaptor protein n=1 Tax=Photobacterium damselae TaxID=38293 RepID=UPI000D663672|nr:DUF6682 family protein [Photobacterium damselae]AWK83560.1 hypothetical protein BST98_16180 [Photobacterium damselae]